MWPIMLPRRFAFMTTWFALLVVGFITLAIKVVFGWRACTGSRFKLPFIGNFAEKLVA